MLCKKYEIIIVNNETKEYGCRHLKIADNVYIISCIKSLNLSTINNFVTKYAKKVMITNALICSLRCY